jgi:hypothetical protein
MNLVWRSVSLENVRGLPVLPPHSPVAPVVEGLLAKSASPILCVVLYVVKAIRIVLFVPFTKVEWVCLLQLHIHLYLSFSPTFLLRLSHLLIQFFQAICSTFAAPSPQTIFLSLLIRLYALNSILLF